MADLPSDSARELLARAHPLLDQLHSLYTQYFARVIKVPPTVERTRLEQLLLQLDRAEKGTPSVRFQAQQLHAKFMVYRDLWDRKMKEAEGRKV